VSFLFGSQGQDAWQGVDRCMCPVVLSLCADLRGVQHRFNGVRGVASPG